MYSKTFGKMLTDHGTDISVSFGEVSYTGKAFITPLRYKNKIYLGENYFPPGRGDGGHYLYIGTPDIRLDQMDESAVIMCNNEAYTIKRAEQFYVRDEVVYMWAVLVKCGGGADNAVSFG